MTDAKAELSPLLAANHGAVRLLTMNRPEKRNAIDAKLYDALASALEAAAADETVKAVVVTGAGPAYSAGADRSPGAQDHEGPSPFERFLNALELPKPLIGAVNGVAIGIGVTMLGQFDMVLMDPTARLRAPFTVLGVAPEAGSSYSFPAIMGQQRAARFLLTSEWMGADEAVAAGMAVGVSAPGKVLDEAMTLAAQVAEHPLPSLMATKRTLLAARAELVRKARADEMVQWKGLQLEPMPSRGS